MSTAGRKRTRTARPTRRSECLAAARPCPWVSCRYHLFLDVSHDTGTIKLNFPGKEIWELEHTCALDIADEGEATFEQIGGLLNLTRERIRQMTNEAVEVIGDRLFPEEPRHVRDHSGVELGVSVES
jgi:hypothetical protein